MKAIFRMKVEEDGVMVGGFYTTEAGEWFYRRGIPEDAKDVPDYSFDIDGYLYETKECLLDDFIP